MFEVRLSINSNEKEILKFIDFSEVEKGLLRLKVPHNSSKFTSIIRRIRLCYPIKFETYVNGFESVGMVFLSRELIQKSNKLMTLRTYGIKEPISGTVDEFNPFFVVENENCPYFNKQLIKGEDCLFIKFVTKHYHQLLMNKDTKGISSSPVEIRLYIDGNFKPYNDEQLLSTGYEIIDKKYPKSSKFYDLDFISFTENNLDANSNNLASPKYKTIDSFSKLQYLNE